MVITFQNQISPPPKIKWNKERCIDHHQILEHRSCGRAGRGSRRSLWPPSVPSSPCSPRTCASLSGQWRCFGRSSSGFTTWRSSPVRPCTAAFPSSWRLTWASRSSTTPTTAAPRNCATCAGKVDCSSQIFRLVYMSQADLRKLELNSNFPLFKKKNLTYVK